MQITQTNKFLKSYKIEDDTLTFVALGPHENSYRDVKR
jgi:hypothetical protein